MKKNEKMDIEVISRQEGFFERLAFRAAKNLGSAWSLLIHTVLFVGIFSLRWAGLNVEQILLILTTIVSLEAIYMSIFIQMTVNRHSEGLSAVQEDIEDIQEDVEEISEDIEGIQEEVKEIGEDVDEISEDIEDISDEIVEDEEDKHHHDVTNSKLEKIEETLHRLLSDIEGLKK
ncbi:MAG: hypothetical protein PHT88_02830 [Candidatus Moranbacteria bacterium]|nr:hypothetical protein [Candidatus Moranbacteria bacterium]